MATLQNAQESIDVRLGADLKFPIAGNFQAIKGLDVLLQDIQILLLTMPGERVFRPDFGCNLRTMIWENMDVAVLEGAGAIEEALDNFEPRIRVSNVDGDANVNTGLIIFKIQFTVIETDTPVNLVFPFRTGTQLSFQ